MKPPQIRVKICGLRDVETIRAMNGLSVDEIGFVFANSRRQVSPVLAGELIHEVHQLLTPEGCRPRTVGVFVDAKLEQLRDLLEWAPLDIIQLHGDESPELCAAIRQELGVQVWKVFSMKDIEQQRSYENDIGLLTAGSSRLYRFQGSIDAVLIDTAGGGTGQAFAWHVIEHYSEAAARIGVPLYVAGGLHPNNVRDLLELYSPSGVDVSSGVETGGVKDIDKIRHFVERVRQI